MGDARIDLADLASDLNPPPVLDAALLPPSVDAGEPLPPCGMLRGSP